MPDFMKCQAETMAGETGGGGDREGPSSPGPTNSISWVGPGGPNIYNEWALFTSL